MLKVRFLIEGNDPETLWARAVGTDLYQLDNSPFYTYGVSYRDVVRAPLDSNGVPTFQRIETKNGHRTLRVRTTDGSPIPESHIDRLLAIGAAWEGADVDFGAIDVPPEVDFDTVIDELLSWDDVVYEWEYADPTYEDVNARHA